MKKRWWERASYTSLWVTLVILVGALVLSGGALYKINTEGTLGLGGDKELLLSPSPDIELYYTLDGLSGNSVDDSSENNYDGTAYGNTKAIEGVVGNGFEFDGDDYIISKDVDLSSSFTFSTWIKLKSLPTNVQVLATKSYNDGINKPPYILQVNNAGFAVLFLRSSNSDSNMSSISAQLPQLNRWYLYTVTFGEGNLKVYLDGNLVSSKYIGKDYRTFNNGVPLYIGSVYHNQTNTTNGGLDGSLDDLMIYSRALNNWEISGLHKTALKDLQVQYDFDTVTSGNTPDASDNRYNGRVTGADLVKSIDNNALKFDGRNDYVSADSSALTRDRVSILAWVKPYEITGLPYRTIAYTYTGYDASKGGVGGYGLRIVGDDGSGNSEKLEFFYFARGIGYKTFRTTSKVPLNKWSFVGATFDGSKVRIYVDGKEYSFDSTEELMPQKNFYVGAIDFSDEGIKHFWSGEIDNVRVYDTVISKSQIDSEYDSTNLILYHDFDDINSNDQVVDKSNFKNYNHDGDVYNAVEEDDSMDGDAIRFDGDNDYIEIPDTNRLDLPSGSFTISLWVKQTGNSNSSEQILLDKRNPDDRNTSHYQLAIESDRKISFTSRCNMTTVTESENTVSANSWHHIAIVRETNRNKIYLDGVLDETGSVNGCSDFSNSESLMVAGPSDLDDDNYFEGILDEFKMYSRALSSSEIEDVYEDLAGEIENDNNDSNNNGATSCTPQWECTWGQCLNSVQTPTCIDTNNCGTETGKPGPRACSSSSGSSGSGSSSSSSSGGGSIPGSSSSSTSSAKIVLYVIIGLLLLGIIIIGTVIFLKSRSKGNKKPTGYSNYPQQRPRSW